MTVSEFLTLCKKKIHLLIIFPLVCAIGTGVFCWFFLTNDYTSTVPIYVLQKSTTINNNTSESIGISSSEITTSQQLSNDIAVLVKSNRVNKAVMDELGIDSLDAYTIKVSSNEKNRVINLSVTGKKPEAVAQVVNCIARQISTLVVEVMNVEAVNIMEEAQPATEPSGPPRLLIVLIAILVGLFLAIVIIVLGDMLDTTVKSKEDIEDSFKLPVLAQVPFVKRLK